MIKIPVAEIQTWKPCPESYRWFDKWEKEGVKAITFKEVIQAAERDGHAYRHGLRQDGSAVAEDQSACWVGWTIAHLVLHRPLAWVKEHRTELTKLINEFPCVLVWTHGLRPPTRHQMRKYHTRMVSLLPDIQPGLERIYLQYQEGGGLGVRLIAIAESLEACEEAVEGYSNATRRKLLAALDSVKKAYVNREVECLTDMETETSLLASFAKEIPEDDLPTS